MLDDRFAARLKRLAARLETPPGLRDLVPQAVAADGVTQLRPAFARRRALGWAGAVLAAGDRRLAAADSLQLADWSPRALAIRWASRRLPVLSSWAVGSHW